MPPANESAVRRWLLALRLLVGASLALLATGTVIYAIHSEVTGSAFRSMLQASLVIALLPYALSLWWLLTLDERKGMALALGWAPIALTISAVSLPNVYDRFQEKEVGVLALGIAATFPVAQVAIIFVATQLHALLPRGPGRSGGLGRGFLQALGFVALMIVASVFTLPSLHWGQGEMQRRALATLQRIADCSAEYARAHPAEGFPDQLARLGPAGSGCLGPKTAAGEKDGYRFTYSPGEPGGAGRREAYVVLAAPLRGSGRLMHFRMDHSTQVRYAYDREPTFEDPLVPPRR